MGVVNSMINFLKKIKDSSDQSASLLILLLCGADCVFICLGIAVIFADIDLKFYLSAERGYAETFQYIKFLWITLLFIYIMHATKQISYLSWVIAFSYLLFDDAMQIHEILGNFFAQSFNFNPKLNLRHQDYGELLVSFISGSILIALLSWAYVREDVLFRKRSKDIGLLVSGLIFFGVFIDFLNEAVNRRVVDHSGVIEDGGEMLFTSLILWYVFNLAVKKGNSTLFLVDLIHKKNYRKP